MKKLIDYYGTNLSINEKLWADQGLTFDEGLEFGSTNYWATNDFIDDLVLTDPSAIVWEEEEKEEEFEPREDDNVGGIPEPDFPWR